MSVAIAVVGVMGPVLLAALAGFVLARSRSVALSGLTDALFYVFVPALLFSTLSSSVLSPGELGELALAACLVCVASGALGWLVLRAQGRRSRGFLLTVMFANNANMGISLCKLAFGDHGLALATAYYAVAAMLTFSLGLVIASPGRAHLEMFKAPFVHAAALGLSVRFLEIPVPKVVHAAAELLGQAAIPTMLFSLGCRLATVELGAIGLALQATAIRLLGGFGAGWVAVMLLGSTGMSRAVILLQASMPAAVINFVLAEKYDRDPHLVSSIIAVSILASLVSVPILLAWLMSN
ncbi:MAG: AEC family transporter [Myxococcales bacterium]|nr:AEC family transporter [Myxococcales bacterium]MDD9969371.1 AEC family transporter [Myxococcales bacterium]